MFTKNGNILKINGNWLNPSNSPVPSVLDEMQFIYLANDYDGTKIPNAVTNSTFGDYLVGDYTLSKEGSGSLCYLYKERYGYLYKDLTETELDLIKAVDNTYTFFIRMFASHGGIGGIMSCRNNDYNTFYMIRCENNQLQIHTNLANNCGSNFMLNVDRVYKVQINGDSFQAKNLDNNAVYNLTSYTYRYMGTRMMSFSAGYGGETNLDRFYAFAGIPRATTAEEDEIIKTVLMNQSL